MSIPDYQTVMLPLLKLVGQHSPISVKEAIEAYTISNAYAEFGEDEKGSITPGKLPDFVLLSDDILAIDPILIEKVQVEMTA